MGNEKYVQNLKEALEANHMTVNQLAKETGIPGSTLYSMIHRGNSLRIDTAIRIGTVLNIPPSKICRDAPENLSSAEADLYQADIQKILLEFDSSDMESVKNLLKIYAGMTKEKRVTTLDVMEQFDSADMENVKKLLKIYAGMTKEGRDTALGIMEILDSSDMEGEKNLLKIYNGMTKERRATALDVMEVLANPRQDGGRQLKST